MILFIINKLDKDDFVTYVLHYYYDVLTLQLAYVDVYFKHACINS